MPRKARKKAKSGIYHVMLRGIDRQSIFEDEQDNLLFLQIVYEYKELCEFKLYAYCLMNNHAHLLIQTKAPEELETIFKRIAGRYVYWYNAKYQRVGHLFQDRFKSEPVEDNKYLLTVLRYIHLNPVKACICEKPEDYPYSSYSEYLEKGDITIVDTEFIFELLSKDDLISFHREFNEDVCLELTPPIRHAMTDDQARVIIQKYSHCKTAAEFQKLDVEKQKKSIITLHEKNVSVRQLNRLTGVSKGIVEKWLKTAT